MSFIDHRRSLHAVPELGDQLPKTVQYVRSVLEPLGCQLSFPTESSVCAFFNAGRTESIAFRANMSALPMEEATGLPFASLHPGCMHASGHDAHMAILLELAEFLSRHLDALPRNVLLIFQPAEGSVGGASDFCESGLLERFRVRRIFGLHLWPGLPEGAVYSRPGPLMARSNEVTVTVEGRSIHMSHASEGRDAMSAGITYLQRAYDMMDALPLAEPRVLRFGKMTSGDARNTVSGRTVLEGSLRTYREETFRFCRQQLREIGKALEAETGCSVDVFLSEGFPAVWNHEALFEKVSRELGAGAPAVMDAPVLAAEDFSYYQQYVPGLFFLLGTGDSPKLNTPGFTFRDEAVLPAGAEFLEKLLFLA